MLFGLLDEVTRSPYMISLRFKKVCPEAMTPGERTRSSPYALTEGLAHGGEAIGLGTTGIVLGAIGVLYTVRSAIAGLGPGIIHETFPG